MVAYATRPYPSAGASYELELYLAVDKCDGLARGFYHYDAGGHALVPIDVRTQQLEALLTEAQFAMDAPAAPQIVITIAARFGRMSWKYSSLAYALILKDVGVLIQTLYLMATDMGLGGCAIGSTNIDLFAQMTGIEFHVEGPVGQFALGRGAPIGGFRTESVATRTISGRAGRASGARRARNIRPGGFFRVPSSANDGALRVRASDDPAAARHFNRAVEDLAAAGLDALRRRVDVADVEIVEPEGSRDRRRLGEHAADHLPAGGEELIRARLARCRRPPSASRKARRRKPTPAPSRRRAARASRPARCGRSGGLLLAGLQPLEQREPARSADR